MMHIIKTSTAQAAKTSSQVVTFRALAETMALHASPAKYARSRALRGFLAPDVPTAAMFRTTHGPLPVRINQTLSVRDHGRCPPDFKVFQVLLVVLGWVLSLIHISEPTRPLYISYAVFCLKKGAAECPLLH